MTDQASQLVTISSLLFSIVWICGFSIILSFLSIEHYNAQIENSSFRQKLSERRFQIILWSGLSLVSLGFAGNGSTIWERVVWLAVLVACGALALSTFFNSEPEESLPN